MDLSNKLTLIIGSGCSLRASDIHKIKYHFRYNQDKLFIITINQSYQLVPDADILYACDYNWWQSQNGVLGFNGLKYSCNSIDKKHKEYPGVNYITYNGTTGLDENGYIRTGGNSGYQALHLAYNWGAKDILLLGFDMKPYKNKNHWFGNYGDGLNNPKERTYKKWIENFNTIYKPLKNNGVAVYNANIYSSLDCFDKITVDSFLEGDFARKYHT